MVRVFSLMLVARGAACTPSCCCPSLISTITKGQLKEQLDLKEYLYIKETSLETVKHCRNDHRATDGLAWVLLDWHGLVTLHGVVLLKE